MPAFVGRTEPLARLSAAYRASIAPPGGAGSGWAGLVLVTGEAGIGKTALLTRFASQVAANGGTVVWGTCWETDQAPAWWPWTQALRTLIDRNPDVAKAARPELAAIVPELTNSPPPIGSDTAARVRIFEAAAHALCEAAASAPVIVILDDLHWADRSTVDLLRFLAHQPQIGALMLIGAYRICHLISGQASQRHEFGGDGQVRDAIRRISDANPELGTHLDRSIRTGMTCRYEPDRAGQ